MLGQLRHGTTDGGGCFLAVLEMVPKDPLAERCKAVALLKLNQFEDALEAIAIRRDAIDVDADELMLEKVPPHAQCTCLALATAGTCR